MALRALTALQDRNGNRYPMPEAAGYVDHRVFAAATAETHTAPTGAMYVMVIPTVDSYVNLTATAAVPAADVTDGSGSFFVPAGFPRIFALNGDTSISFIASAAGVMSLEFYS